MSGEDESDQLPESGPSSQTPDDDSPAGSDSRDEATENPGGADGDSDSDSDEATGNPPNAG
jgi:hypothetical protein